MKTCPICKEEMAPDTVSGWRICKKCRRQFQAVYRKRKCMAYLGNRCNHCGRNDIEVLTFHHKDPKTKLYNISEWISGIRKCTWEEVKRELDKCELLCLNCHKIVHTWRHELKDFIPYLTQKQRQELEADIITDDELEVVMYDHGAMSDILMETEDIPVKNPRKIALEVKTRNESNFLQKAEERANTALARVPGGTLGIVTPKVQCSCVYCGTNFEIPRGSNKIFCSDYCKEQAHEEAIENGQEKLFNHLVLHGFQLTGAVFKTKEKNIRQLLHLIDK